MLYEESAKIKEIFKKLDLPKACKVLDIGSSTMEFRTDAQPFIEKNVFMPLRRRGFKIIHADVKKTDGVDLALDIEREVGIKDEFDILICANILEHVRDIDAAVKNILKLIKDGGYAWISMPHEYPYHPDPIDTMFRPTNKDLERLFPNQAILKSEILNCKKGKISILFIKIHKKP